MIVPELLKQKLEIFIIHNPKFECTVSDLDSQISKVPNAITIYNTSVLPIIMVKVDGTPHQHLPKGYMTSLSSRSHGPKRICHLIYQGPTRSTVSNSPSSHQDKPTAKVLRQSPDSSGIKRHLGRRIYCNLTPEVSPYRRYF